MDSLQNDTANQEFEQLKSDFEILVAQKSQLEEVNQAWETYYQDQMTQFRRQLENWIPLDDDWNLEQIGQQIINELEQLVNTKFNSDTPSKNKFNLDYNFFRCLTNLNMLLTDPSNKFDEFIIRFTHFYLNR